MEDITIQNVEIETDSLRVALNALDDAIRSHIRMRDLIEELLLLQEGKIPARGAVGRGRGRRARGKKTLRETIVEVLKASKTPLKPIVLRDKVLDAGYLTTATPQSFYTAIFNTATNEPGVVNTAFGFQLKSQGTDKKKAKTRKKRRSQ